MMNSEVERALRITDQILTGHSILRDRYSFRATFLDLTIMFISAWVTAMGFVDPSYSKWITIPTLPANFTIGVLGFLGFTLALAQSRVRWKERASNHRRAAQAYSSAKHLLRGVIQNTSSTNDDFQNALENYHLAGKNTAPIPERDFLKLKQAHLHKIQLSRLVSAHPSVFLPLASIMLRIKNTSAFISNRESQATASDNPRPADRPPP